MNETPYWLKDPKKKSPFGLFARKLATSRFFAALIGFCLVSAVWSHTKFGAMSPVDFPFFTWTGCAIDDYLSNATARPQIAMVGSSLMLAPIGGVDADYLNHDIDAPRHHRSLYFENQYKKATGKDITTFNFALPGEMPSDAYLITRFLFKGEKKPDILLYGVGPRDFMDNQLVYPAATDPYLYLSRFGDVSDHIGLIAPEWEPRLNYELGKLFYTYGHKSDIATTFARFVAAKLVNTKTTFDPDKNELTFRRKVMPDFRPFEVARGECLFRPTTPESRSKFTDNIDEYRKRYKTLKWSTYTTQTKFIMEILDICKERGIKPVIVAMPITDLNRELLGENSWAIYRHGVKVLAQAKGATFIDMQGSGKFSIKDFGDTVHLHSGGGAKLLGLLAESLAKSKDVTTALSTRSDDWRRPYDEPAPQEVAGLKETHL